MGSSHNRALYKSPITLLTLLLYCHHAVQLLPSIHTCSCCNTLGSVCVSVCASVCLLISLTSESLGLEASFLVTCEIKD